MGAGAEAGGGEPGESSQPTLPTRTSEVRHCTPEISTIRRSYLLVGLTTPA